MSETTVITTDPAQETTSPGRRSSVLNRLQSERIITAEQVLTNAGNDPALVAAMTPFGYDADAFAEGLALLQAAKQAFLARQQVIVARTQAADALTARLQEMQRDFMDYRRIGRALFASPVTRQALGLSGRIPDDQHQLLQYMRTAYHVAAATPEYATLFARSGYTQEKFDALAASLEHWLAEWGAYVSAYTDAARALQERDERAQELYVWMQRLRTAGRIAARTHPEVTAKLGLE